MRRRRSSNRSGQALVEFALTVPILMLLVVGVIEFGRLMSAYQTITDTAREAARRAALADRPCNDEHKQEEIREMIFERLRLAGLDPENDLDDQEPIIDCNTSTQTSDPTATVTLVYDYHMGWLGPMMGWVSGRRTVSLRTQTNMRQE